MTLSDKQRWLVAEQSHEDLEIYHTGQSWEARTVYGEGHDGINYVYEEAPTLPDLLAKLLEALDV